jgi:hypothetical protein
MDRAAGTAPQFIGANRDDFALEQGRLTTGTGSDQSLFTRLPQSKSPARADAGVEWLARLSCFRDKLIDDGFISPAELEADLGLFEEKLADPEALETSALGFCGCDRLETGPTQTLDAGVALRPRDNWEDKGWGSAAIAQGPTPAIWRISSSRRSRRFRVREWSSIGL